MKQNTGRVNAAPIHCREQRVTRAHLWLPSNFLGSRQLLICPKGANKAATSLRVASNATFRTTSFVPLALPVSAAAAVSLAEGFAALPPTLRRLSCSANLCPSSIDPCHGTRKQHVNAAFMRRPVMENRRMNPCSNLFRGSKHQGQFKG